MILLWILVMMFLLLVLGEALIFFNSITFTLHRIELKYTVLFRIKKLRSICELLVHNIYLKNNSKFYAHGVQHIQREK